MFAVVKTGGKQYKVQPGDIIRVEKIAQELGAEFDLTEVLMIGDPAADSTVGKPIVPNAKVTVVVTKQTRDRKVIIFKKKRRQGYRKFKTHRQPFTELFVKSISMGSKIAETETQAQVKDVDQLRMDKIFARSFAESDTTETVEGTENKKTASKAKTKTAPKKAVKKGPKLAAKKAKTTKKTAVKALASKSAAKKTTKKTT